MWAARQALKVKNNEVLLKKKKKLLKGNDQQREKKSSSKSNITNISLKLWLKIMTKVSDLRKRDTSLQVRLF